jgi:hypothetical protein
MTLAKSGGEFLTVEEWDELNALRVAINVNPASVHPIKQERFTELFVRSLLGKGSYMPLEEVSTNVVKS